MRQVIKKALVSIGIIILCICVGGCSETELEERCFPMLAAVGYEDDKVNFNTAFPKAESTKQESSSTKTIQSSKASANNFEKSIKKYESRLNKQVDYNHLKVLVMEEELLENKTAYHEMLDYLAKTERFPRNTYVCVVDDLENLFALGDKVSQDIGSYLEEFITKQEENSSHILTLGDLLDEKENQTMILYMPYLEVEENYVEWGGYVNILGEFWKDF